RAIPLKKGPRHCGQWAGSESAEGATSAIVVSDSSNRNPAIAPDLFIISFTSGFCAKALRVKSYAAPVSFSFVRLRNAMCGTRMYQRWEAFSTARISPIFDYRRFLFQTPLQDLDHFANQYTGNTKDQGNKGSKVDWEATLKHP